MAEITTATTGDKPGVRRSKKHSTRVDLTPMVDLGFLLITFFIFTTTMSEPMALGLVMPDDTKKAATDMTVGESAALTIVPMDDDKIFYYHGSLDAAMKAGSYGTVNYSFKDGIGQVIRDKQLAMDRSGKVPRKDLMLMIKPTEHANYQNVVNILDEVKINDVKHYALMEVTTDEEKAIVEKNGKL
jgi:biopolymer transport protein ExbD